VPHECDACEFTDGADDAIMGRRTGPARMEENLKPFASLLVLGLTAMAGASSASSFSFHPTHADFTATGSLTVTSGAVTVPCSATLEGATQGDKASITSAAFSGAQCGGMTPDGLPWSVTIDNGHKIVFHGVSFTVPAAGICGPGNVHVIDNSRGKLTITKSKLKGEVSCSVSADFKTKPVLTVTGK